MGGLNYSLKKFVLCVLFSSMSEIVIPEEITEMRQDGTV
jgi:hypothetical protein